MGCSLLFLGSHRLRNLVYGGLAVSSFPRVEYPDDRHPDEYCRAIPEMMALTVSEAGREPARQTTDVGWPVADMPKTQSVSLLGVKRTWPIAVQMSAYDPKRTSQIARTSI